MTYKSWRHIAQATATISGCAVVAFATRQMESAWRLLGLLPVDLMGDVI